MFCILIHISAHLLSFALSFTNTHPSTREWSAHMSFVILADFLREDTLVGTSFLRVGAHDDDFGTNAAITYSLSLEQPEYLRVNPITGWVFVNQPISQVSQSAVINILSVSHSHRLYHMAACGSVLAKSMNKLLSAALDLGQV